MRVLEYVAASAAEAPLVFSGHNGLESGVEAHTLFSVHTTVDDI
jgi:hypothetical protein